MGITGLNTIVKNEAPEAVREVRLSAFAGHRVAIDGSIMAFKCYHTALKTVLNQTQVAHHALDSSKVLNLYLYQMKVSIERFLNAGIIPVYVTDGPNAPPEKEQARSKRRKQRQDLISAIDDLETKVFKLEPSKRTSAMTDELRKLYSRNTYPSTQDTETVMFMLETMGIPIIKSTGEAEWTCAELCKQGECIAVYSTDTDCMVHQVPIMISKFLKSKRRSKYTGAPETFVSVNVYSKILEGFNWSPETFTDLAINCGCDYNSKLKGVGPNIIVELMKTYKSIENFPMPPEKFSSTVNGRNYSIKTSMLGYETCRAYFGHHSYDELIEDYDPVEGLNLDLNLDALANHGHERLMSIGIEISISQLATKLANVQAKFNQERGKLFDISQHFEDNPVLDKQAESQLAPDLDLSRSVLARAGLLSTSSFPHQQTQYTQQHLNASNSTPLRIKIRNISTTSSQSNTSHSSVSSTPQTTIKIRMRQTNSNESGSISNQSLQYLTAASSSSSSEYDNQGLSVGQASSSNNNYNNYTEVGGLVFM